MAPSLMKWLHGESLHLIETAVSQVFHTTHENFSGVC